MTEVKHPNWRRAEALVADPRFCEFLDACHAHSSGWPHNRVTATEWMREECRVESLGALGVDPLAAVALGDVEARFALWDRNEELAL